MEITAVTPSRSFESVVKQIEQQITNGTLSWGQKLPTEREMSARFGVSRVVVREAIRALSTMGLVEVRHGSGIYVRNNLAPAISRVLTLSVTAEGGSIDRLFEFRATLEVAVARLAAERRDDHHLAAIEKSYESTADAIGREDVDAFSAADGDFHTAIATAASNDYLHVTLDAVREMHREIARFIVVSSAPPDWRTSFEQHKAIGSMIHARNGVKAAEAMEAHIMSTASRLKRLIESKQLAGERDA